MNYKEANDILGKRDSRKIKNNTYVERSHSDCIVIRLHSTNIITFHPNDNISLSTGGWHSRTTFQRIKENLDKGCLYSHKYNTYFGFYGSPDYYIYNDDMILYPDDTTNAPEHVYSIFSRYSDKPIRTDGTLNKCVTKLSTEIIYDLWQKNDNDYFKDSIISLIPHDMLPLIIFPENKNKRWYRKALSRLSSI